MVESNLAVAVGILFALVIVLVVYTGVVLSDFKKLKLDRDKLKSLLEAQNETFEECERLAGNLRSAVDRQYRLGKKNLEELIEARRYASRQDESIARWASGMRALVEGMMTGLEGEGNGRSEEEEEGPENTDTEVLHGRTV